MVHHNKKIFWHLKNYSLEPENTEKCTDEWILGQKIDFKSYLKSEEIMICKYFWKTFGFYPRMIFSKNPYGVLLFVSNKLYEIIHKKFTRVLNYFPRKVGTRIYILKIPSTVNDLIHYLS